MASVRACELAAVAKCSISVAREGELASVHSDLTATPHVDGEHFGANRRLHAGLEFERVFATAVRSSDRYFTILARRNELGRSRLGLAISKRVAKRAVDRSRLKRIAREVFRKQTALPACDYIVLARAPAATTANAELRRSLEQLFDRAGAAA